MNYVLTIPARLLNAEITKYIAKALLGSALITLGAKITVPFYPVPFTMQSFAVMILGLLCSPRLAVGIGTAYIIQTIMGLPVGNSPMVGGFYGPTAGYIFGYLPMIWIISTLTSSEQPASTVRQAIACLLGSIALFAFGYLVLAQFISADLAWKTGVVPFIGCDLLKIALAIVTAKMARDFFRN